MAGTQARTKYIEEIWQSYKTQVIPKQASQGQVTECRRAFFAGARGLFTTIMAFLDPGTEATEDDLARMTDIQNELDDFVKDVQAGKA